MLLLQMLKIWQSVAKCSIINSIPELIPIIHQSAIMDSIHLDLNSIKIDNTSHERLFEYEPMRSFRRHSKILPTSDEKMILVDNMLSCAILIADIDKVRFLAPF